MEPVASPTVAISVRAWGRKGTWAMHSPRLRPSWSFMVILPTSLPR